MVPDGNAGHSIESEVDAALGSSPARQRYLAARLKANHPADALKLYRAAVGQGHAASVINICAILSEHPELESDHGSLKDWLERDLPHNWRSTGHFYDEPDRYGELLFEHGEEDKALGILGADGMCRIAVSLLFGTNDPKNAEKAYWILQRYAPATGGHFGDSPYIFILALMDLRRGDQIAAQKRLSQSEIYEYDLVKIDRMIHKGELPFGELTEQLPKLIDILRVIAKHCRDKREPESRRFKRDTTKSIVLKITELGLSRLLRRTCRANCGRWPKRCRSVARITGNLARITRSVTRHRRGKALFFSTHPKRCEWIKLNALRCALPTQPLH